MNASVALKRLTSQEAQSGNTTAGPIWKFDTPWGFLQQDLIWIYLYKDIETWGDSLPNVGELSRKVYPLPSDPRASPNMNGDSGAWITPRHNLDHPHIGSCAQPRQRLEPPSHQILCWTKRERQKSCFNRLHFWRDSCPTVALLLFHFQIVVPLSKKFSLEEIKETLSKRNPWAEKQTKLVFHLDANFSLIQSMCSFYFLQLYNHVNPQFLQFLCLFFNHPK